MSQINVFSGFYIFDDYSSIKKIMDKKGKSLAEILHNIWNASIDMYFITFARMFIRPNEIPVLVTSDKHLYKLDSMMKYHRISFDNNGDVIPEGHEMELLDNLDFLKMDERDAFLKLTDDFNKRRKAKGETRDPYDNSILNICEQLENELNILIE